MGGQTRTDVLCQVAEDGWDLWTSSSPAPALAGSAGTGCPGHLSSSEYLQERRLHSPSGQPVSVFDHPHSKVFSSSDGVSGVSGCAYCLLQHQEPLSLLFSRLNSPSSLSRPS